jgi:2-polyprenyl-3-methyl-5-hydroxy-6-metoxy-1,4-benzoquinol methylase
MNHPSQLPYDSDTRDHYKSAEVAEGYHHAFTRFTGLGSLRHWLVAARERSLVGRFLDFVRPKSVLDIPAGTGKLAGEFARRRLKVHATDISPQMLDVARRVYGQLGHTNVSFSVADAEYLDTSVLHGCEMAVCLRLLHRVPRHVKSNILESLSRVSPNLIASFGVSTPYHKLRSGLRVRLFGGRNNYYYETYADLMALLGRWFKVERSAWVLPQMSQEMIFLLRTRRSSTPLPSISRVKHYAPGP